LQEGVLEQLTPIAALTIHASSIRDLTKLQIARGTAKGPSAGVWYRVTFPTPVINPSVVAVAEAKPGTIIQRVVDKIPDISLKTIPKIADIFPKTIPKIADIFSKTIPRVADITSKQITRIQRDDFNNDQYCKLVGGGARDRAKALAPPWPLDMIWNWFCDTLVYGIFYAGWYASGWILNLLWDSFLQPQIDRVRDSINSVVNDANLKVNGQLDKVVDTVNEVIADANQKVNSQVDEVVDTVNEVIADANQKVNSQVDEVVDTVNEMIADANAKINSQVDRITERVNLVLKDLYSMWGLPNVYSLAVVQTRNLTATGFEWLSLGNMTIHWIAVGEGTGGLPLPGLFGGDMRIAE
jgi:ElaB/YqjD/DUF883 family membrane-anchored ribosome-binding protein